VNNLSDQEISLRKKMANSDQKKEHLGMLVRAVRDKYVCFANEQLATKKSPTFKAKFETFEGNFRKWVISKIDSHVGNHTWFNNEFSNKINEWEKKASSWKTDHNEERELWTFLGYKELIELVTKDKGPIDFWGDIFKEKIEEGGFVEKDFWLKSMQNMAQPRNPGSHGMKGLKIKSDKAMERFESDLDTMTELIKIN
jgi:hypothetical protein